MDLDSQMERLFFIVVAFFLILLTGSAQGQIPTTDSSTSFKVWPYGLLMVCLSDNNTSPPGTKCDYAEHMRQWWKLQEKMPDSEQIAPLRDYEDIYSYICRPGSACVNATCSPCCCSFCQNRVGPIKSGACRKLYEDAGGTDSETGTGTGTGTGYIHKNKHLLLNLFPWLSMFFIIGAIDIGFSL